MIPFYYVIIGFAAGALSGGVAAIVMKPAYDRTAEQVENWTADECDHIAESLQATAVKWQKRAAELRKPGK